MLLKHSITWDNDLGTIWIHNHSHKVAVFQSDDKSLVNARINEINHDCNKSGNRPQTLLALYRFAKHHGTVKVMKPVVPARGMLTIKPEGSNWILTLVRGKNYIIIKRDVDREVIKKKYFELLDLKKKDPTIFDTMWEYALAKQKLEMGEVAQ